ncbi:MAG TPA: hypothetical protein VHJ17_20430 [Thermomonospora sp.]|nr:hypothetical protein [Thermomonospora sp.]
MSFDTPIELAGPWRSPLNLLSEQTYGEHASIHDPETAQGLGLSGAAVEGPTHFSQFDPLMAAVWGSSWFERGCISAHFTAICNEGERTRASATVTGSRADIRTEKADGTTVLKGTATLGAGPTELGERLARFRTIDDPVIFEGWTPGRRGSGTETLRMDFDTHLGDLYPFTLGRKLEAITEPSPWYTTGDNPWGRPIVPIEMISVLAMATFGESGLVKAEPSVGLFLGLEIRMLGTPVFVGSPYALDREVLAVGESRRVESSWIRTSVTCQETGTQVAEVLLHQGVFKGSYPGYPEHRL